MKPYVLTCVIVFCTLLLMLCIRVLHMDREGFMFYNQGTRMVCPTRNQSYDLRGDLLTIPRVELPANNSGFGALRPDLCPVRGDYILGSD